MSTSDSVTAIAPGKVILFGEHAINRGQPALSAAVGLHARCRATRGGDGVFRFRSGGRQNRTSRDQILALWRDVEEYRAIDNLDGIRRVAHADYFGPQKYVLGSMFREELPDGMELEWESEVPPHSGLGSGGSAFTAMVAAVCALYLPDATLEQRAAWAHRGDVIAHGGVASALDSQTSLLGGVIRFTGEGLADQVPVAPGFSLIVANSGVGAATREVNTRVRLWLAERPQSRMAYFQTIGALSRAAEPHLAGGNWDEVGRLMNLNQFVLEKIGISCPPIDRLIDAALGAGAFGAKISGSGGGGIIIALLSDETKQAVNDALTAAGGTTLTPAVAVPGTRIL